MQAHEANNTLLYPVVLRGTQMECGDAEAVIIGGMVLDIHATPSIHVNSGTTTPGKVCYVQGGVARNVAECMSKLGAKPYMISALGFDMAGNLLLEQWKSAGLSTEGILKDKDIETPVVCNIFDVNGEVAAGVASVEALEKYLTPDWILHFKSTLLSAPVVLVDANLSCPSLEASCKMAADTECPVWFEPVSVTKSRRISSIVKYVTFASPNEDELIAMANALSGGDQFHPLIESHYKNNLSSVSLFQMLKPAIWVLLEKGIKVVLVTLGSNGVFLCSKGGPSCFKVPVEKMNWCSFGGQLYRTVMQKCPPNCYSGFSELDRSSRLFVVHFPTVPASVVRLTGAGDCLVGGTLASICAGLDIMQSVSVGIAAAKAAVEVEANVPYAFSLAAITDDAKSVYSGAKVLFHQSML
ncbi:pseudouridine kinase [Gastrolobium bilobum]|uniref:pseudouridine kinase n=1 Tax=Gastrolobium bilobum TaxID=150636 RepID=UPI002AB083CD|nr:pseudouridine kinase [Gastrolobium bilobum]XP_061354741.1 pseudouridine kinase [Gastrolobium bilobum]XP_061354742.1 pseudouridine kinase [Gastrolobium bilobum]